MLVFKSKLTREFLLFSIYHAQSGHPGGSLSVADILTYLYFEEMNIKSPAVPDSDRFILSKGHVYWNFNILICFRSVECLLGN